MSIKPGQSGFVTIDPAIGTTNSATLNPLSPVEFGRTVSGGVADDWNAGTTPGTITIGTVSIAGSDPVSATGRNRKIAEQKAAASLLARLLAEKK